GYASVAQRLAYLLADSSVALCAKQNPLHWRSRRDCFRGLGEAFRQPAFSGSVFSARTESNFCGAKIDMVDRVDADKIAQISWGAEALGDVKIMQGLMLRGTKSS